MRLSVNEFCLLEDAFNAPIKEVLSSLENADGLRMNDLRKIVHAALNNKHNDLTVEEAGNIMTEYGPREMVAKLTEALFAAFPEAKVADKDPK